MFLFTKDITVQTWIRKKLLLPLFVSSLELISEHRLCNIGCKMWFGFGKEIQYAGEILLWFPARKVYFAQIVVTEG